MTSDVFKIQVERLKIVYGERNYPDERTKLLWLLVRNSPNGWFESTVSRFIGTLRQAPLVDQFQQALRGYEEEKKQEETRQKITSGDLLSTLSIAADKSPNKQFANMCIAALRDRREGRITRKQWDEEVLPHIEKTADLLADNPNHCKLCGNTGYAYSEDAHRYRFLHRCYCPAGSRRPENAYGPANASGTRQEYKIPFIGEKNV